MESIHPLYQLKKFTTEYIDQEEITRTESFFTGKTKTKIQINRRVETYDELMSRVLQWINENEIQHFQITTIPSQQNFIHNQEVHFGKECIGCYHGTTSKLTIYIFYQTK